MAQEASVIEGLGSDRPRSKITRKTMMNEFAFVQNSRQAVDPNKFKTFAQSRQNCWLGKPTRWNRSHETKRHIAKVMLRFGEVLVNIA